MYASQPRDSGHILLQRMCGVDLASLEITQHTGFNVGVFVSLREGKKFPAGAAGIFVNHCANMRFSASKFGIFVKSREGQKFPAQDFGNFEDQRQKF